MSLLPLLYELERAKRLHDQHLALALAPDDLLAIVNPLHYLRHDGSMSIKSSTRSNKEKFKVNLDVQHFGPEEISVKTVDGFLVVEGSHEEKRDEHGWVTRKFTRRYALPEGCTPENVECRLSSDGVLTVTAPLAVQANERIVPIVPSGPIRTQIETNREEVGKGEEAAPTQPAPVANGE